MAGEIFINWARTTFHYYYAPYIITALFLFPVTILWLFGPALFPKKVDYNQIHITGLAYSTIQTVYRLLRFTSWAVFIGAVFVFLVGDIGYYFLILILCVPFLMFLEPAQYFCVDVAEIRVEPTGMTFTARRSSETLFLPLELIRSFKPDQWPPTRFGPKYFVLRGSFTKLVRNKPWIRRYSKLNWLRKQPTFVNTLYIPFTNTDQYHLMLHFRKAQHLGRSPGPVDPGTFKLPLEADS